MGERRRQGFTIIEVLVVISIIGMLMALLLPAVQQAREAGRRNTCANNLKNVSLAVLNYESARGQYPGYREPMEVTLPGASAATKIPVSWVVTVLPYLERTDIYDLWRDPQQSASAGQPWPPQIYLQILVCPSSPPPSSVKAPCVYVVNSGMGDIYVYVATAGVTSVAYPADWQANGIFFNHFFQPAGNNLVPFVSAPCIEPLVYTNQNYVTVSDGSSHTLMISENNNVPTFAPVGAPSQGLSSGPASWADPGVAAYERQSCFIFRPEKYPDPALKINGQTSGSAANYEYFLHPASAHPGGVNASFCDGHVRYLADSIDYGVFCLLMTPHGAQCNTPGTVNGLDGAGGIPTYPASGWYTTSNYSYLRTALVDDSTIP